MFSDFEDINVGDFRQIRKEITIQDVEKFVLLTGDDNPLHIDPEFASKTPFKDVVVHGMLGASFISTIIGTKLPGPGALWMSQDFNFVLPVRLGDHLLIKATVTKKINRERVLILETQISNQKDQLVLTGTARVKVLEQKKAREKYRNFDMAKVALITGAAGGIGSAIAHALASKGVNLILHYNSRVEEVNKLYESLRLINSSILIHVVKADLSTSSGVEHLINDISNEGLEPNIFINNAAAPIDPVPVNKLAWSAISDHLETQSKVMLRIFQALVPIYEKQGFGRIVSISSAVSQRAPTQGWLGYTINKGVVESISRQIALEFGFLGVTANCIAPGMCETPYIGDISEKVQKISARQSPNRRIAVPQDIAELAAFLVSTEASHINGQVLHVNGGASL